MSSKPPHVVAFSSIGPESESDEDVARANTQRSEIGNGADSGPVVPLTDKERDELLRSVSVKVERVDAEVDAMSSALESVASDARETRDAQKVIESDVRDIKDGQGRVEQKVDALLEGFAALRSQLAPTAPAPAGDG